MVMRKRSSRETEARFSEGESVDVAEYLRDHGNPDAAEEWEKYDGRIEEIAPKKASKVTEKRLRQALAKIALENPRYRGRIASILGIRKSPK